MAVLWKKTESQWCELCSRESILFFLKCENLACVHCSLEGSREIRNEYHVEISEISGGNTLCAEVWSFSLASQEGREDDDKMNTWSRLVEGY